MIDTTDYYPGDQGDQPDPWPNAPGWWWCPRCNAYHLLGKPSPCAHSELCPRDYGHDCEACDALDAAEAEVDWAEYEWWLDTVAGRANLEARAEDALHDDWYMQLIEDVGSATGDWRLN